MRDYYKIESVLLDDISRNINSEKTSFTQGARKTFSNSYLKTCSDTSIKLMSSHIEELYSKINSGYNSLSTWLTDYTNDAKNVEKGLSSSDYNVTDFYTNMTLKATLNHKDVDINKSPDVIDGLNNSNKTNYPYIVNGNIDSSYETLPYTIGDDSKEKVALYNETVSLSDIDIDIDELLSEDEWDEYDAYDKQLDELIVTNIDIELIKRNRDEILKIIEELESGQDSSVRNSNKKDREIKIKSYKEILAVYDDMIENIQDYDQSAIEEALIKNVKIDKLERYKELNQKAFGPKHL